MLIQRKYQVLTRELPTTKLVSIIEDISVRWIWIYLLNKISVPYDLFNTEIWNKKFAHDYIV